MKVFTINKQPISMASAYSALCIMNYALIK